MSQDIPNLYDFATSELSQDATLAYILSWAKPEYRKQYPSLNRLGEQLLRSLIERAAKDNEELENITAIEQLEVGVQRDRMDVWAEINKRIFLIVEDKTDTHEHSDQMCRYVKVVRGYGKHWIPAPVFVKTGNVSKAFLPTRYGIFLRDNLLHTLESIPATGNTIIEEFRRHLKQWERETQSYKSVPHGKWCWKAIQGYYMALEEQLGNKEDIGWIYVSNPSGGFLAFWWARWSCPGGWKNDSLLLFLQIESGTRLTIRARACDGDNKPKVDSKLMYEVLMALEKFAKQERFSAITVDKAGRFRGGETAAVAQISFDGREGYLAEDDQGNLDMETTLERLKLVMELVDEVRL